MFTGIIEDLGIVKDLVKENDNLHLTIQSVLASELKVDQSVSHNGVCLTVVALTDAHYTVTAIKETLEKTNIGALKIGATINLERGLKLGARLDGHMVQGHVDQIGNCTAVEAENGSWIYSFKYDASIGNLTIEKGSITVNGVSLTVVNSKEDGFSVAIIPYTHEHTNFNSFEVGTTVNLEFDVIGKYVARLHANR
ncbi:MAG: riboflavin synthase [Formosa sp.]|jgi:riboflavin synthase|nr:riboflavin synthase [Formosa sp.]MDC3198450.1 riboflavin synthase [Flavobacteriaceae bacterium]MDC3351051.1 riboflavin synthase [Flavobacteriaceae bacterium]|tara:strand:- start:2233 stop:2820 length:588 start_codon:yes stop_codon:yes gene_type:complete